MNYSIGDFLIRLKNAYMAGKKEVTLSYSRVIASIGKILEEEGYVKKISEKLDGKKKFLRVELLYKNSKSSLKNVVLVSKPSVHVYVDKKHIPSTRRGFGITIISTSKGIMTEKKARKENVGGEVLCQLF
ncbi:MAG: 30S ribosomal protein S8 [Candidatus Levybacteria bacterium RIFCSPLOWO2_01_FULL_36_10]|nr:MAG: 30S ribosomal protein S8 [Candidatus Levybacteria bacterium RIFCSPLOWO2_01_FULL_36_10]